MRDIYARFRSIYKNSGLTGLLFQNQGYRQVILKNTFWLGMAQGVTGVVNFFLTVYVIRVFGATEYGKFAFAFSFVAIFSTLFDFGLSTAVTREFAGQREKEGHFSDVMTLKVVLGVGVALLVIVGSFFISSDGLVRGMVVVLGIYMLLLEVINLFYALIRARQRMEVEAAFRFVQVLSLCAAVVAVIFFSPSILNLSLAYVGATLATLVLLLLFFLFKESSGIRLRPSFNASVWKVFLAIGWYLALAKGVGDITTYTDSVLLGYWGMNTENGWYNAAVRLNRLALFPMAMVSSAIFPALVGILRESREKFLRCWKFWMKWTVFFAIMFCFGVLAKADEIISFTYTEDFLPAAIALKILILMATLVYINNLYYHVLLIFDHQKRIFYALLCGAIMNVLMNLILIPRMGINGAALATVLTHLAILFFYLVWTAEYTIVRPFDGESILTFSVGVASGLVMYGGLALIDEVVDIHLFASLTAGVVIFTVSHLSLCRVLGWTGLFNTEKNQDEESSG